MNIRLVAPYTLTHSHANTATDKHRYTDMAETLVAQGRDMSFPICVSWTKSSRREEKRRETGSSCLLAVREREGE